MNRMIALLSLGIALSVAGCSAARRDDGFISNSANEVRPLTKGQRIPGKLFCIADGNTVNFASLYQSKPSVLIFYRGGWCPYCNEHLSEIADIEAQLIDLGFQVLAISPDNPTAISASLKKSHFCYQLVSDSDMQITTAFGLAFKVDEATIDKYHEYGIDLEKSSGKSHHLLPVPAVYIIDKRGNIKFAHWNPDYKTRMNVKELVEAAKKITSNPQ